MLTVRGSSCRHAVALGSVTKYLRRTVSTNAAKPACRGSGPVIGCALCRPVPPRPCCRLNRHACSPAAWYPLRDARVSAVLVGQVDYGPHRVSHCQNRSKIFGSYSAASSNSGRAGDSAIDLTPDGGIGKPLASGEVHTSVYVPASSRAASSPASATVL